MRSAEADKKVHSIESLHAERARLRKAGKTVVQCHGCFDIVHPGHIRYLRMARSLGDVLVVTVSADDVVMKGYDRPYIPEDLRLDNLMFDADRVYLLDWQLSIQSIGAVDVAYFLGWSMQNDQRRATAEELIGRYHARSVEHGIAGYSLAQCEDHVRRSMLGVAMIAAYGSVAVPATNERGQALLDAMVDQTFSAVDDMNSGEFMPA